MSGDKILLVFGPDYNGQSILLCDVPTPTGETWQDTLKVSNQARGIALKATTVIGGLEDALDINNECSLIDAHSDDWYSGGKYCFTVKGGSRHITLSGLICRHGSEVDVDLGNWSDQSQAKTTDVSLNLKSWDGSPVTIRVLNGDKPTLVEGSGPYKFLFPHPDAFYHGFCVWWFMKFHRFFK